MSNIIQIKRGVAAPGENNLAPYELGYVVNRYVKTEAGKSDTVEEVADGGYLYIGDLKKDDSSKTTPAKIKAGYADTAGIANNFSDDAKNIIRGIKVSNAVKADSATNADNATKANYANSAGQATSATSATNATSAINATNATNADNFKINNQYVNYETLKSTLLKEIYPIGSIYMSVNSTSPANLFGGTWERLEDRFLIGASNTLSAGVKGGSESIELTKDNLPSHDHGTWQRAEATDSTSDYNSMVDNYGTGETVKGWAPSLSQASGRKEMRTTTEGKGTKFNILPPYLAVYMWKRTA